MKSKPLIIVLIVLGIAAAAFFAWWQISPPPINLRPSAAVGEVLAEELARLLANDGKVVVIGRASAKDSKTAAGEQIASFIAASAGRPGLKVLSTEWLAAPAGAMMATEEASADQLAQFIDNHPDANTLVVFAGLPPLSAALQQKLRTREIKLMAVGGYGRIVRQWLEARALTLAVVPRFGGPPTGETKPKSARDWFAREFQLLTPESVGTLPY